MKKMKTNLKKAIAMLAVSALALSAFAQEATDGFIVPLGEDFSKQAERRRTRAEGLDLSRTSRWGCGSRRRA